MIGIFSGMLIETRERRQHTIAVGWAKARERGTIRVSKI
jgi:hypothetical protein